MTNRRKKIKMTGGEQHTFVTSPSSVDDPSTVLSESGTSNTLTEGNDMMIDTTHTVINSPNNGIQNESTTDPTEPHRRSVVSNSIVPIEDITMTTPGNVSEAEENESLDSTANVRTCVENNDLHSVITKNQTT